jgi:CheY-like chemotaxis protein
MWVESTFDEGSTFSVILPCVLPEMPAGEPVIDEGEERPLVLVIDEDDAALQLVQDYLSEDAYHVIGTSSPAQALELARKWHPVAVITDVIMPSAKGWEVLRTLKSDPATADIPVIVLSVVEQKTLAFYLGAADYLIKPVSREALQESLARVAHIEPRDPILVVDDNADERTLVAALLERAGYEVVMVDSGEAALKWLGQHQASLILLDLMMPVMSGFDVMAALNKDDTYRDIPVIAVTAKHMSEDELQQLRQNIAQVIQKHRLSRTSLVEQVQLALNKRLQGRTRQKN